MTLQSLVFIVIPTTAIVILSISLLIMVLSAKTILKYKKYTLHRVDVRDDSVLIEGNLADAGGLGLDSYDYYLIGNEIYLRIYQQGLLSFKPRHKTINIKLDGDFSQLNGIYLVQSKEDPVNIWP